MEGLLGILYNAHSIVRWIVVLLAVITFIFMLAAWLRKGQVGKPGEALMGALIGTVDLQMLLGIAVLLWLNLGKGMGWPRQHLEHAFTMILVVVALHMTAKWKKAPGPVRARNTAIMILIAGILIYAGVMRLSQGWQLGPSIPL